MTRANPTELDGHYNARRVVHLINEGHTYRFPRGRFHRSPILTGVAVTVVEKHNQSDEAARILYPVHTPPVMAFGHEMDWSVIGPVLQRAREALGAA